MLSTPRASGQDLCRYVTRPAVAGERLSLTTQGLVRYALKTPYRDGTTRVVLEPTGFVARLAALRPRPRVHLTRFHGVFAPNHRWRSPIVPGAAPGAARPDAGARAHAEGAAGGAAETGARSRPTPPSMNWARRLKRVCAIEIERCERCGRAVRVVSSIEDPAVIERIPSHLGLLGEPVPRLLPQPEARGPPRAAELID